jgi:hypothetical protein
MRTRAVCCAWSDVGSPGSQAASFHTCQVLRPRRAVWTLAFTRPHVLPSAFATASAPGIRIFARLNGWPVCSSTDASPPPSRATAHGSRPMWLATPSSYRTCTDYSLPVSRRTAKDSGHYQRTRAALENELVSACGGPHGSPFIHKRRSDRWSLSKSPLVSKMARAGPDRPSPTTYDRDVRLPGLNGPRKLSLRFKTPNCEIIPAVKDANKPHATP